MVDQAQHLIYGAFSILHKSRQGTNIGIVEMEAYCRMFSVRDVTLFVKSIQSLDEKLRELNNSDHKDEHSS